jgi:glycosyltransferase involved in cell wall biosynthesis
MVCSMSALKTFIPWSQSRRRRRALLRSIEVSCLALEGVLTISTGYLLALLMAARAAARSLPAASTATAQRRLRLVVLIPAHDEQDGIQATLRSLADCTYPDDARRTLVIADNCTDRTADRARRAGAEVWERTDPARRGKGHALEWALERLQSGADAFDAVVIVDADCIVSPNLLSAIASRVRDGASAVQVDDVVGNLDASTASALRFAAFVLMVNIRFSGKQRLGLSCGLVGTGMAFTRDLLRREPWTATSLGEDGEYHMRLVQAGERVEFVSDAWVRSAMPTSLGRSYDQQARWEKGKLQLIHHWSPRLLASGVVRRDLLRMHAGLEHLVPPQSLIAAGSAGSALTGLALGSRRLVALSAVSLTAQLVFVLGGLLHVRAPLRVYRALLIAPALIVGKMALYARLLSGRGPASWVRTEREAPTPPTPPLAASSVTLIDAIR